MMMIFVGFALGFLGYLPVGNINMTVVQLSVSETRTKWQAFILFAAFMEFVYCFFSLSGMELLLQDQQFIGALNWSAVVIFLLLGIYTLFHSLSGSDSPASFSGVKRGIFIAIFNPLQIPFWLIWGVYVMENGWVKKETGSIAFFSLLCSVGTIAVLWLYAVAGKKLVEKLNVNRNLLNTIIGSLLILLAVLQTIKLLR